MLLRSGSMAYGRFNIVQCDKSRFKNIYFLYNQNPLLT